MHRTLAVTADISRFFTISVLQLSPDIDLIEVVSTIHSTQNRSFWKCSFSESLSMVLKKQTQ